ncbi:MAG: hypothetical protein JWN27_3426 [Candidatus Eremiobacteraeota bacterium]|nr:hypothetical protein [Candidatus Eremiobacteraeota bacterium]
MAPMARQTLIAFGAQWRFRHTDAAPANRWTATEFDDSAWDIGTAPLGYSVKDLATRINPGTSFKARPAAAQLRRTFDVDDATAFTGAPLTLALHRNTSAAVFLNGVLVAWEGVPWPDLTENVTTGAFSSSDTSRFPLQFSIPARALRTGRNVIAVDLRHAQRAYGALTFDLSLASGIEPIDRTAFAAQHATPVVSPITTGARVPDFPWIELGTRVVRRLSEFAGRPFLLQFSGAECRPCWKKVPIIRRWADAGLTCLSISSWGTVDDMEVVGNRHRDLLQGIVVGAEPAAYDAYQTACYQHFGLFNGSILVDADGTVLAVASGFTLEDFQTEVRHIDVLLRARGFVFPAAPDHISVIGDADDWHVVALPVTEIADPAAVLASSSR